jgi:hypothetical protein
MNLIAFTVYGDDPIYREGLVAQVKLRDVFYPGWDIVCFSDQPVPALVGLSGVTQLLAPATIENPMAWRLAAADLDSDRVIFRDLDSRFGRRETAAVAAWIASGLPYHVMRDHPHHYHAILGGMWGITAAATVHGQLLSLLRVWQGLHPGRVEYGADEAFLSEVVWPRAQQEGVLQHDAFMHFPGGQPFPTDDHFGHFVGEKIKQFPLFPKGGLN